MNKLLLILIFSFLPLLATNQTNNTSTNKTNISPSFDCSKATIEVEKIICSDEQLSMYDKQINILYKELLKATNNNPSMIQEQKDWIKYYRNDPRYTEDFIDTMLWQRERVLKSRISLENYKKIIKEDKEWQKGQKLWEDTFYKYCDYYQSGYKISGYENCGFPEEFPTIWAQNILRILDGRINYIKENLNKKPKTDNSYLSYAEILEDKNATSKKNKSVDFYSKVRPANSFKIIGGKNNSICTNLLNMFNEEGKCRLDLSLNKNANLSKEEDCIDKHYWHFNNSAFVKWENIDVNKNSFLSKNLNLNDNIFVFGLQYTKIDIDMDGNEEYVYRYGGMLSGLETQYIYIFDNEQSKNYNLNSHKNEDEWISTKKYSDTLGKIINDKKSWELLYPKDDIKLSRNVNFEYHSSLKNLYRTEHGIFLIQTPWDFEKSPELLIFSLYKDNEAKLECILMPKEI